MSLILRCNNSYLLRFAFVQGRCISSTKCVTVNDENMSPYVTTDQMLDIASDHATAFAADLEYDSHSVVSRRSHSLSDKRVCTALCRLPPAEDRTKQCCQTQSSELQPLLHQTVSLDSLSQNHDVLKELLAKLTAQISYIKSESEQDSKAYCDNGLHVVTSGDFYDDNIISRSKHNVHDILSVNQVQRSIYSSHNSNVCKLSSVLLMNSSSDQLQSTNKKLSDQNQQKPNLDQLRVLQDHIADTLPKFFKKSHNYRIYTQDVIFMNNIAAKPYTISSISKYVLEISKLKILAHMKYANLRINVLQIGVDEQEATLQVRWRVSGIPQMKAFMFWKFLPWHYRSKTQTESEWLDGLSTLHVNNDGLIFKHVMDNVMRDNEKVVADEKDLRRKIIQKLVPTPGLASSG